MSSKPDNRRSDPSEGDARERLVAVYAAFNHAVATRPETLETLRDESEWLEPADDGIEWARRVGTAVVEHAAAVVPESPDHLQALPEDVIPAGDTVVVTGAYIGTTADGSRFDVSFAHVYDAADGTALERTTDVATVLDRRVTDA